MTGVARLWSDGEPSGTAFFLGEQHALTAFHCVGRDREITVPVVTLSFRGMPAVTALVLDWDCDLDIALLWIRDSRPVNVERVQLERRIRRTGEPFCAEGFPEEVDRIRGKYNESPTPVRGTISSFPSVVSHGGELIQLFCQESASGQGLSLRGMSGSPVLVGDDDRCIGVMMEQLSNTSVAATGGICFAVPIAAVLARWHFLERFSAASTGRRVLQDSWYHGHQEEQRLKTRHFVGRSDDRARAIQHFAFPKLTSASAPGAFDDRPGPTPLFVIHGPPGSGKTALAYQIIADLAAAKESTVFANGWLSVNARGFDPKSEQRKPQDILVQFLLELGEDPNPSASSDVLNSNLRMALRSRELLLLVDNVVSYSGMEELCRLGAASAVIVTSRVTPPSGFSELPRATSIQVNDMTAKEGVALLRAGLSNEKIEMSGARVIVTRYCGGLPLAISIVRGILQTHPNWTTSDLLDRFINERPLTVLSSIRDDEPSVRRSFNLSYRSLGDDLQLVFRLLGSLPASGFSAWVASTLLPASDWSAEERLSYLADVHLLERAQPPRGGVSSGIENLGTRYQFHDLIREYSHALLDREERENPERRGYLHARFRIVAESYWAAGRYALPEMTQEESPLSPTEEIETVLDPSVRAEISVSAGQWLSRELPCILIAFSYLVPAVDSSITLRLAVLLARASAILPVESRHRDRFASALEAGLTFVEEASYPSLAGELNLALGRFFYTGSEWLRSISHLKLAIEYFTAARIPGQEAFARSLLADSLRDKGEWEESRHELERAQGLFQTLAMLQDQYETYPKLGRIFRYLGKWPEARDLFEEAIVQLERDSSFPGQRVRAAALHDLGDLLREQGYLFEALQRLEQAERIFEEQEDELFQARVISSYVDVYRDMRQWEDTKRCFLMCDPIFEKYSDTRWRGRTQLNYAIALRYRQEYEQALEEVLGAQSKLKSIEDPKGWAMCDESLGAVKLGLAQSQPSKRSQLLREADESLDHAFTYFAEVKEPLWTAKTQWAIARLAHYQGRADRVDQLSDEVRQTCARLQAVHPETYEQLVGP
jgi:tetratricopeptide (TPR) repeat protein